jgi:hypothetical protein
MKKSVKKRIESKIKAGVHHTRDGILKAQLKRARLKIFR